MSSSFFTPTLVLLFSLLSVISGRCKFLQWFLNYTCLLLEQWLEFEPVEQQLGQYLLSNLTLYQSVCFFLIKALFLSSGDNTSLVSKNSSSSDSSPPPFSPLHIIIIIIMLKQPPSGFQCTTEYLICSLFSR